MQGPAKYINSEIYPLDHPKSDDYLRLVNKCKSLFKEKFTPTIGAQKETNQKSYKLLRFRSERSVEKSNWITNRNVFNNVAPPNEYKDTSDDEDTYHMAEWLSSSSETDNLGVSSNRAMINYIRSSLL